MSSAFVFFDYLIFFGVLFLTFFAAYLGHRKQADWLEYALMGRRLTLPFFVATLVATWYGGILGVAEIAFKNGFYTFLTQAVFWYAAYLLFAWRFAAQMRSSSASTTAEYFAELFGPQVRSWVALLSFVDAVPVSYVLSCGFLAQVLFGIDTFWGGVICTAVVTSYVLVGGLRSVVYSDVVQFVAMMIGVILLPSIAYLRYGSLFELALPAAHYQWTGDEGLLSTMVWGLLALGSLVDPGFHQRCFAAVDGKTAVRGVVLATVAWCIFDIAMILGAMYAAAVVPTAGPKTAYLDFAVICLPDGVRGLFFAGILATILSTLDSYLFIGGEIVAIDFLKNRRAGHYFGVLLTALFSIALSLVFSSIRDVWKTLGALSVGSLLMPLILAHFANFRLRGVEFMIASISSAATVVYWRWFRDETIYGTPVPAMYPALAVSLMITLTIYLTRSRDGAQHP